MGFSLISAPVDDRLALIIRGCAILVNKMEKCRLKERSPAALVAAAARIKLPEAVHFRKLLLGGRARFPSLTSSALGTKRTSRSATRMSAYTQSGLLAYAELANT